MNSNLPPGVSDSMIPGNRPEDVAWEKFHEQIDKDASECAMHPEDAMDVWKIALRVHATMLDGYARGYKDGFKEGSIVDDVYRGG